jgi:hypothetical protein
MIQRDAKLLCGNLNGAKLAQHDPSLSAVALAREPY